MYKSTYNFTHISIYVYIHIVFHVMCFFITSSYILCVNLFLRKRKIKEEEEKFVSNKKNVLLFSCYIKHGLHEFFWVQMGTVYVRYV